ncbi:MAG TPA: efflux RND transporter periplasmic adaptor subunit [Vicinamibacterales bacterium]|nr:efflux RND transporter periplasmic adaptor subunit [Vicinamibacterales bacterium]
MSQHGLPEVRWRPTRTTIAALILSGLVFLIVAFLAGYLPLQQREATLRAEADAQQRGLPRLVVMRVERGPTQNEIKLPGTMQALTEAPILARTDGYLKRRLVDIGDRVRASQVLAEIDAPEVDQQIHQAEAAIEQAAAAAEQAQANLEQGRANRELARVTAERIQRLTERGISPEQDGDQSRAQLAAQDANVQALEKAILAQRSNLAAAKANLARLQELQGYRLVKAPFDGVITLRNVDVGALVSTGNTLLYRIAQIGTLRTYVNVPQAYVTAVRVGQSAALTVSHFPGRSFQGTVARTANALDPATRTMLVEVDVPNADGALFPGTYAEVDLSGSRTNPPLVVPAAAILFRTDGAQVAVVQADHTVHLQKIDVGRDYGDRVEILQGVEEGATIVAAPGDSARDGAKIVPVLQK